MLHPRKTLYVSLKDTFQKLSLLQMESNVLNDVAECAGYNLEPGKNPDISAISVLLSQAFAFRTASGFGILL